MDGPKSIFGDWEAEDGNILLDDHDLGSEWEVID